MIWVNFGKWAAAYGRIFCQRRIYVDGWKWTPFVRVEFRYLGV